MLEIIKPDLKINFSEKYSITSVISGLLVAISLFLVAKGMIYGVDFRGGAEVLITSEQDINMEELRTVMEGGGFDGFTIQSIGEEAEHHFLIKLPAKNEKLQEITDKLTSTLNATFGGKTRVDKIDIVGPKAGEKLRQSGFLAMFYALIAIMIYIGLRFDFKYSPGAIVALFHDVTIILGIFAFAQIEFTLQIVAALLAVIGYSVNDTVVIYDRVREHERKNETIPLSEHINNAASETLSRTLLTSGTTLFISMAMYLFGGPSIKDFFFAISLGVIIGTYSSLFVAAPVTLFFDRVNRKKA